jgi:hypothetical protein
MTYAVGIDRVKMCGSEANLTASGEPQEVNFNSAGVIAQRQNNTDLYEACYWNINFSPNFDIDSS